MNATFSKTASAQTRGISLLEVTLAVFILAIASLAILSASVTSATATQQSGQYAAAVSAARKKMEEIATVKFASIVGTYGVNGSATTFKVYLNEGAEYQDVNGVKVRGVELPGYRKAVGLGYNFDAGEVVVITNESLPASTYGYICSTSLTDTYPDFGLHGGVNFGTIPIDLDCDGQTTSGDCSGSAKRLPVGVIIRWEGPHGTERYELWSILTGY